MGIAQRANVISTARERGSVEKVSETVTAAAKQTFLLFEGPDGCRMAVPLSSVARLEELPITHIEIAGAQSVAQYRGQILPLVNLENALSERRRQKRKTNCRPHPADNATLPVVVCNHEQHQVGLLVDQILDIIEDSADLRHPASRPGVLYSAVIGGKVTELIDIPAVLRAANVKFTSQIKSTTEPVEVS